jgi:hypothetical protein
LSHFSNSLDDEDEADSDDESEVEEVTPTNVQGLKRGGGASNMNGKKLLTPKIGTIKRLICGPSLVKKCHSAGSFPQSIR